MEETRQESLWHALGARTIAIGALTASAVVHSALAFGHSDELLYAGAFAGAGAAAALAAFGLTRIDLALAPLAATLLLAALLLAYPLVHAASGDPVDALGLGTKTVEAVGLLAALRARADRDASLSPVTAIAGFLVAFLLLSVAGGSHVH